MCAQDGCAGHVREARHCVGHDLLSCLTGVLQVGVLSMNRTAPRSPVTLRLHRLLTLCLISVAVAAAACADNNMVSPIDEPAPAKPLRTQYACVPRDTTGNQVAYPIAEGEECLPGFDVLVWGE